MTAWSSRLREEAGRIVARQRGERDGGECMGLPTAPTRTALEQLRPGRGEDEERDTGHPIDDVVDEVEQVVVGPVEVFEDEHERSTVGERLEEASPGGERLARARSPAGCPSLRDRPSGRRWRSSQRPRAASSATSATAVAQLRSSASRRIGLEDPGLRLHHLGDRPERRRPRRTGSERPCRQKTISSGSASTCRRARRRAGSCRCPERRRA